MARIPRLTIGLVVLALAIGYGIGTWRAGATITEGSAYAAEDAISVETDDWTYAIPLDVRWVDANETHHLGDRPECLAPGEANVNVRFAYVDVSVEGSSWRPVVWVDCR